jgi:hypothetical protein
MSHSQYYFQIFSFFVFLGLIPSCTNPKKETSLSTNPNVVTTTGQAAIYQGDRNLAKTKALLDAKRTAVRKVIGEEISSRTKISDGQSLGSSLLSQTDGLVKSFEILSEKDGMWDTQPYLELVVRSEIEKSKASLAVTQLLQDVGNPRIAVLLWADTKGLKSIPGSGDNQVEAVAIEALQKQGNKIVGTKPIAEKLKSLGQSANDLKEGHPILYSLQDLGAEVLLVGSVKVQDQPAPNIPGVNISTFSAAATGSYRIIQLWGDGKIIGTGAVDERGAEFKEELARESAGKKWAEALGKKSSSQIRDEWFRMLDGNSLVFRFKGLGIDQAISFKNDLMEYTGVKSVNDRKTSPDLSEWELTYPGRESDFVEELTYKKERGGFRFSQKYNFDFTGVKKGQIEGEFKKR